MSFFDMVKWILLSNSLFTSFISYIKDYYLSKIYAKVLFIELSGGSIMNSCQLTASITAVANAISSKLNIEETTLLATVLVQLGDTLATIATQRAICEAKDDKGKN